MPPRCGVSKAYVIFRPRTLHRLRETALPRPRERILANLESLYREAFERAGSAGDDAERRRLDFDYRRDQLYLEAILDVRDLLGGGRAPTPEKGDDPSLLEQVQDLRRLTRFPFGR